MLSGCKYAIFDNDGTILNSMHYWRLGFLEYLLEHGYPIPDMTLNELLTHSSRNFALEFAGREGLDISAVGAEMEQRMDRHYQFDVRPKPGIEKVFEKLRENGAKMCVATAAPKEICRRAMQKFAFDGYFQFITGGDEIKHPKSDPAYFEAVSAMLGAETKDCWVFEDSLYAIKGAKKANCRVIAVEDPGAVRGKEEILALADVYITDYRQLL